MIDDPLDEPFLAIALSAFITQSREQQGWPDQELTRRRAYAMFEKQKKQSGRQERPPA